MNRIKLREKNAKQLGRIIVTFFMTQVVTITVTAFSIGFSSSFILLWLRNHLIALIVGIPTGLLLSPHVEKLIESISSESNVNWSIMYDESKRN